MHTHPVLQRSMVRPREGALRAVPLLVCERHGALEGLSLAVRREGAGATPVVLSGGQSRRSKQHSNRKRCILSNIKDTGKQQTINPFWIVSSSFIEKSCPAPFVYIRQDAHAHRSTGAVCTHRRSQEGVIVISYQLFPIRGSGSRGALAIVFAEKVRRCLH